MNAAETIRAAIKKLEQQYRDGTSSFEQADDDPATVVFPGTQEWRADFLRDEDAELFVTLHRTIDAQLEILRVALPAAKAVDAFPHTAAAWADMLASVATPLAHAILGGVA